MAFISEIACMILDPVGGKTVALSTQNTSLHVLVPRPCSPPPRGGAYSFTITEINPIDYHSLQLYKTSRNPNVSECTKSKEIIL